MGLRKEVDDRGLLEAAESFLRNPCGEETKKNVLTFVHANRFEAKQLICFRGVVETPCKNEHITGLCLTRICPTGMNIDPFFFVKCCLKHRSFVRGLFSHNRHVRCYPRQHIPVCGRSLETSLFCQTHQTAALQHRSALSHALPGKLAHQRRNIRVSIYSPVPFRQNLPKRDVAVCSAHSHNCRRVAHSFIWCDAFSTSAPPSRTEMTAFNGKGHGKLHTLGAPCILAAVLECHWNFQFNYSWPV